MITELPLLTPTTRFSNRADNYVKYRPGYPLETIPFIEQHVGLASTSLIADIGSGTGLFAEPLLEKGYRVVCIEPNEEMRRAGESRLARFPLFSSQRDTAEDTGLATASVDVITVAQAFHWLDHAAARKEFHRILKPGGSIVLAWNIRKTDTPFLQGYSRLRDRYRLKEKMPKKADEAQIAAFFSPRGYHNKNFENIQLLNFDSLKGQLLSSSIIPLPGHDSYEPMISELIQLFVACNENGFVKMEYETKLFWGTLG